MRDITALHPFLRMLAPSFVARCMKEGLYVKITDCVRTKAEQDDCIRRGTSTVDWWHTHHAYGLAFDFCFNDKDNPYPNDLKKWKKAGEIGKSLGLTWGGDWKKPDRPHFQLDAYGLAADLIKTYHDPKGFMAHKDFKITTPKTPIVPTSSRKKILWLQVMLTIAGYLTPYTGVWDATTKKQLKAFWKATTGKECTGRLCSVRCIGLLK